MRKTLIQVIFAMSTTFAMANYLAVINFDETKYSIGDGSGSPVIPTPPDHINNLTLDHTDTLVASDSAQKANSVSISGDKVIFGAPHEGGSYGGGRAYIFKKNNDSWVEEKVLIASDETVYDFFGGAVSIDGDLAIVGASGENDKGAAYIFRYNGSDWIEEQKLVASDAQNDDFFGGAVSISGDAVVIGASGEDSGGSFAGAAYIFKHNGSTWVEEAKLLASDKAANDYFGENVSIDGDRAIVGAMRNDDGGSGAGSAYIFKRSGSTWIEEAKLLASDRNKFDFFGGAVSISGDLAVIGAFRDDEMGSDAGAAYIFKRNGNAWNQELKFTSRDTVASQYFGSNVAIDGNSILVGSGEVESGDSVVYLFKHNGTEWVEGTKVETDEGNPYNYYSESIDIDNGSAIVAVIDGHDNDGLIYTFEPKENN